MDKNLNKSILDKITKTCVCKSITREKIKDAIFNGASTYEEVKKVTGAGTGCCKGKKCSEKINDLIKELN